MTNKIKKLASGKKRGVSLLISIGLVSIIVFFSLSIANMVVSSTRQASRVSLYKQAEGAAETGINHAIFLTSKHGAGFSQNMEYFLNCQDPQNPDNNCHKVRFTLQGQVPENRKYSGGGFDGSYGIPVPGTGSAGESCDPLKAYYDKQFYYKVANTGRHKTNYAATNLQGYLGSENPEDHPCNWNKISLGEMVTIPLYVELNSENEVKCQNAVEEADGTKICNPDGMGFESFALRVRTPCEKNGDFIPEMCAQADRYDLYVEGGADWYWYINNDKTILAWSIEGTNTDGEKTYYGSAFDNLDKDKRTMMNSEIFASRINLSNENVVLQSDYATKDLANKMDEINNFLLNSGAFSRSGNAKIHRPVLKLSVISLLTSDLDLGKTKIPYLEYQLLINQTKLAPAAEKSLITAEGFAGEHKSTIEVSRQYSSTAIDYVIQQ
jgi:hypothetical protein